MRSRLVRWLLTLLLTAVFTAIAISIVTNWWRIVPIEGALVVGLFLFGATFMAISWRLPDRFAQHGLAVGVIAGGLAIVDVFVHQQYWVAAGLFLLLILFAGLPPLLIAFHRPGVDPISRARARRAQQNRQHSSGPHRPAK